MIKTTPTQRFGRFVTENHVKLSREVATALRCTIEKTAKTDYGRQAHLALVKVWLDARGRDAIHKFCDLLPPVCRQIVSYNLPIYLSTSQLSSLTPSIPLPPIISIVHTSSLTSWL